ncbi:MAG: hypothetical protein GXZ05_06535, partial [Gammaproteobacteria bacterium]|nr:hypothetical protein [Gammaproteobacteria bacterium]
MRYLLLCLLCVFGSSAFAAKIQQPPINGFIVTYVSDKNIPIKVGERATTQAAFCNRLFTYSKSAHDREEKPAPHITYTYKVEEVQYGALGIYGTFSPGEGGCATFGTLTTLNTFNPPETVDETYYDHLHLSRGAVCSDLSDLVYDPDTKQNVCYVDPPKPPEPKECKAGEEILRYGFSAAGGEVNYNPNVCYEGCNYNYESRSGAGIEMPDYPGIFKYNVYYKSDGSECSAPTPPVTPPDIPDPPEEPCPEGWALGADGSTCFRKPDPDDGGTGGTGGTGGDDGGTGGGGDTGGGDGGTGG